MFEKEKENLKHMYKHLYGLNLCSTVSIQKRKKKKKHSGRYQKRKETNLKPTTIHTHVSLSKLSVHM